VFAHVSDHAALGVGTALVDGRAGAVNHVRGMRDGISERWMCGSWLGQSRPVVWPRSHSVCRCTGCAPL
jgi:hypothetical protein